MGNPFGDPGTVVVVMSDVSEPQAPRSLDRRTIAIAACIGLLAALLAGLAASVLLAEDDPTGGMQLEESEAIDSQAFLTQKLDTVDGGTTDLESFQDDQPMLVNLWASNCAPCIDEMPLLNEAQAANEDITFVGVATQDEPAQAKKLAEQTGITYPWALDPTGELYLESKGAGMPTTVLLAADGSVVDSKTGSFDNATELQAFLDQAG